MKKGLKHIVRVILAFTLLIGTSLTVYAEDNPPGLGDVVDGSVLTDNTVSEIEIYNPARGNVLNSSINIY